MGFVGTFLLFLLLVFFDLPLYSLLAARLVKWDIRAIIHSSLISLTLTSQAPPPKFFFSGCPSGFKISGLRVEGLWLMVETIDFRV